MISYAGILGHISIILSILFAIPSIVINNKIKNIFYYMFNLFSILSFFILIFAFYRDDFAIKNVFFNSDLNKSLHYKICASWASNDGSILLWNALLSCYAIASLFLFKISDKQKDILIKIISFVNILFLLFTYFISNPFKTFSIRPKDGFGLTPSLQDIALTIHPPILYLGYTGFIVPFILAHIVLLTEDQNILLMQYIKRSLSFAVGALSLGIALGSWWAYRELGWGGFWFFDPVENISLLPWLSAVTLYHFLIITIRSKGKFFITSSLLSIFTFLLVIYGIFLVRSGMLSSIHAFAKSYDKGMYLFLISSIITLFSLTIIFMRRNFISKIVKESLIRKLTKKEHHILLGNIFLLISLFVIILSILYYFYFILAYKIHINISTDYFIKGFIPTFIPICFLAGLSPIINIAKNNKKLYFTLLTVFIVLTILIFSYISISISTLNILILASALLLILHTISYALIIISKKMSIFNTKKLPVLLGHIGFGLLCISISLNSFLSQEVVFEGTIGNTMYISSVNNENIEVKLTNIRYTENTDYLNQIAEFTIKDKKGHVLFLKPEIRFYLKENKFSSKADIFSFLTHDIYLVLTNIKTDQIAANVYYRPFISFIWISCFLVVMSFFMTLSKKN